MRAELTKRVHATMRMLNSDRTRAARCSGGGLRATLTTAIAASACFVLLTGCGATLNPALENGVPISDQTTFAPTAGAGASTAQPGNDAGASGQATTNQATANHHLAGQPGTGQSTRGLASAAVAVGAPLPAAIENVALANTPGTAAYKIGPQDVIEVSVFKVPELNRTVQVADSGTVNLPLLNEVVAVGRTPQEMERELTAKLGAKYLQSPQVTVSVKEYNSQRVTVEGAVRTPGVYPIKGKSTLLQMMAYAGGVDLNIATNDILVFRNRDGKRFAAKFSLDAIRSGNAEDPTLVAGDVVVVNTSDVKSGFNNFLKILPAAGLFALL